MSDARAWVGCLACYNEGRLTGEWVDGLEAGEYVPCHRPMHEEWWVMDHEGYDGLLTGECSPSEAQEIAELIDTLEGKGIDVAAYAAYRDHEGADFADLDRFEEAYAGEWDSQEDFAQNLAEEIGAVDENATWPNSYIDWERAARDLFMGDYYMTDSGYVFRSL